jgi:hypothetical protein
MKLIGLSLSFCVRDILEGKVKLEDVHEICSGTAIAYKKTWDVVMMSYRMLYWRKNPDQGQRIAEHLRRLGKLWQPRLELLDEPSISNGHWMEVPE